MSATNIPLLYVNCLFLLRTTVAEEVGGGGKERTKRLTLS